MTYSIQNLVVFQAVKGALHVSVKSITDFAADKTQHMDPLHAYVPIDFCLNIAPAYQIKQWFTLFTGVDLSNNTIDVSCSAHFDVIYRLNKPSVQCLPSLCFGA